MKVFRPQRGKDMIVYLESQKENHNDDDNLKDVYLTIEEIDYIIELIKKAEQPA
jgi:hypothetical protein